MYYTLWISTSTDLSTEAKQLEVRGFNCCSVD